MTIEQWNTLCDDDKEKLISAVTNNSYIAFTNAKMNPETNLIIKGVLGCVQLNGDTAYINIHKEVKLKRMH